MKTFITDHARLRATTRFGYDEREINDLRSNSFNAEVYRVISIQQGGTREVREFQYKDRFIRAVVGTDTCTIITFLDPEDGMDDGTEGSLSTMKPRILPTRSDYRASFIDRLYCLFTGRLPKK